MLRFVLPTLTLMGALVSALPATAQNTRPVTSSRFEDGEQILLRPSRQEGMERLLILVPGGRKPAAEYEALARRIQNESPLRLWVSIPKFVFDTPNPLEMEMRLSAVTERVRQSGFAAAPASTFLAGHSLGGIMAQGYAKKNQLAGMVLLASYVSRGPGGRSGLPTYGIPVLTLGGEIDGQTRISRLALDAEISLSLAERQGVEKAARLMPVVVLPRVNHSQFSGPEQMASDIPSELDYDTAQEQIASVVSDFLTLNSEGAPGALAAQSHLVKAMETTGTMLEGFIRLRNAEKNWCAEAQGLVFGNLSPAALVEEKEVDDLFAFAGSKPALEGEGAGEVRVEVMSRRKYSANPLDVSTTPETARETSCKLKSRAALQTALRQEAEDERVPCSTLNAFAYNKALESLTPEARARFLQKGKAMRFREDNRLGAGILWLPAGLELRETSSSEGTFLDVRSPALFTELNAPQSFAGMHYCKLISPAQAMEWMLVDGLRP